jgi:hypothetical protein
MPSTILDNVKGSDLPKIWADKIAMMAKFGWIFATI